MMSTIRKASIDDAVDIVHIGRVSVEHAHRDSCSSNDMLDFLNEAYNRSVIEEELNDPGNIYHVLHLHQTCIGFSKVILNCAHENLINRDVMKLDRIYLLPEYVGQKHGIELFNYNVKLAMDHHQKGIWLFTWIGNKRAVDFYTRAGFKVVGHHRFKVTDTHYNEHHQMLLDISDSK